MWTHSPFNKSPLDYPLSKATAPEKVKKDTAVATKIIMAMRPVSAPKRSDNKATLLALGKAATKTTTTMVNRSI
jgi:hypothetical protein